MDRLTARNHLGNVYLPECIKKCNGGPDPYECIDCTVEFAIYNRLAEYEDTGLTPEEVAEAKKMVEKEVAFEVNKICTIEETSIPRLQELANADKECRLLVLPCKVGTPIWWIDVSIEPNDRGKWVTRKRIKSKLFDYSVMDWIDTPIFLSKEAAETALEKEKGEVGP